MTDLTLTLKHKIKEILVKDPAARNNDNDVCAKIWLSEIKFKGYLTKFFLFAYSSGLLPSAETIGRLIRIVKQENPELKGLRKRKSEREVINELQEIKGK